MQAVAAKKSESESPFYQCKLGKHYIDPDAAIVTDPEFESGVTKLQRGGSIPVQCRHLLGAFKEVNFERLTVSSEYLGEPFHSLLLQRCDVSVVL